MASLRLHSGGVYPTVGSRELGFAILWTWLCIGKRTNLNELTLRYRVYSRLRTLLFSAFCGKILRSYVFSPRVLNNDQATVVQSWPIYWSVLGWFMSKQIPKTQTSNTKTFRSREEIAVAVDGCFLRNVQWPLIREQLGFVIALLEPEVIGELIAETKWTAEKCTLANNKTER